MQSGTSQEDVSSLKYLVRRHQVEAPLLRTARTVDLLAPSRQQIYKYINHTLLEHRILFKCICVLIFIKTAGDV